MADKKGLEGIMSAMHAEIERSMSRLRMPHAKEIVPQYVSYCLTTNETLSIDSDLGCSGSERKKDAYIEVEVRVGREGDITSGHYRDMLGFYDSPSQDALRVVLWRFTDDIFKEAFKDYLRRKERRMETHTHLKEEQVHFHTAASVRHVEGRKQAGISEGDWEAIARECTALFRQHPHINTSGFEMDVELETRILVNSDGSEIKTSQRFYSIDLDASAIAVSGDSRKIENVIEVGRQFYVTHPSDLPTRQEVVKATEDVLEDMASLLEAPVQKPCDRPVIGDPEFSAQLLYTILGELLISRCSYLHYLEDRGLKKGDDIFPGFISVVDLPDRKTFTQPDGNRIHLNGHSRYDAQGIPAARIDIIRDGKVAGFPCTREYMAGLELPNGRARFSDDLVVPGVTNLFIRSSRTALDDDLKEQLIAECESKGYDYGFFLEGALSSEFDLEENCYMMTPRMAYRVWARDAVDEETGEKFSRGDMQLVSDVQAVGNPKMTLSYLKMTGEDFTAVVPSEVERKFFQESSGYFQGGDCSIISPSTYFSRMEVKKENYSKTRPPLLPHPLHDKKRR
ncbi:metallopeptidase TldD-related protein [Nanoarchaeota archaeon]